MTISHLEQRFISMALFYPEDSNDIKVMGFETSTIEQLLFAQADGWERNVLKFKELQSAFHRSVKFVVDGLPAAHSATAPH